MNRWQVVHRYADGRFYMVTVHRDATEAWVQVGRFNAAHPDGRIYAETPRRRQSTTDTKEVA